MPEPGGEGLCPSHGAHTGAQLGQNRTYLRELVGAILLQALLGLVVAEADLQQKPGRPQGAHMTLQPGARSTQ